MELDIVVERVTSDRITKSLQVERKTQSEIYLQLHDQNQRLSQPNNIAVLFGLSVIFSHTAYWKMVPTNYRQNGTVRMILYGN